ncbi:MAG TPA: ABC transporter permease [Ktedonobacterales bacterium]|nr:ABC transporter permease [Ktedonobacterales bacterium]
MDTINVPQEPGNIEEEPIVGTATLTQLEMAELEESKSISPFRAAVRRFMRDKRAVFCLALVLFIVIGSFVFPPIYRHLGPTVVGGLTGTQHVGPNTYHDPSSVDLSNSDGPSTFLPLGKNSLVHPLGTDAIGRDILARLMGSVNISIELAIMVEVFDIGLGLMLGTLAGWFGGGLGTVLDRFTDVVFAFPGLLLILLMGASLGPLFDHWFHANPVFGRMLLLTLAIGLLSWPLMMRYVRGQTLELKERQFVEAARTTGTSTFNTITKHIVPNLLPIVIVASTLNVLATIIGEAGISLLGAGLQPPATSLGLMISDANSKIFSPTAWTEELWPCLTLVIIVIAFSFMGDGVSDAFNPRKKD